MRIDASEYKSKDDLGGADNVEPGRYHVAVNTCEETTTGKNNEYEGVNVEVVILAGSTPGQEGKEKKKFLFSGGDDDDDEKRKKNASYQFLLFRACGLMDYGQAADVDPADCCGRECICEISAPRKGGKYPDIVPWSWMRLDDPEAAAVPKDYTSPGMKASEGKVMAGSAPPASDADEYDV